MAPGGHSTVVKSVCGGVTDMSRVMELDIGNSALKWRLSEGGVPLSRGRDLSRTVEGLPLENVDEVRVASVAGDIFNLALEEVLVARGIRVRVAKSQRRCGAVQNSYRDVSKMGVDRWLAMVAAYRHVGERAVLVVDAGTALTVDLVAADGRHAGGYIIPGASLMIRSLGLGTDRVRVETPSTIELAPGQSTGECVYNGSALAQLGALTVALTQAEILLSERPRVAVTGGDGLRLCDLGRQDGRDWDYVEELVLDGLAPVLAADDR